MFKYRFKNVLGTVLKVFKYTFRLNIMADLYTVSV